MKVLYFVILVSLSVGCSDKTGGQVISPSQGSSSQDGLGGADDPSIDDADLIDGSDQTIDDPGDGVVVIDGRPPVLPPPRERITFKIDPGLFALNNGENSVAVRWDGCQENQYTMGGYESDTKCGKAFLHPNFEDHLQEHFKPCVLSAAAEAGINRPEEIFIRHVGTFNNRVARGSSKKSMHAFARAMDIRNFNLFDIDGAKILISTHLRDYENETASFYDGFRRCWSASLPDTCVPGKDEYLGSIGHTSSQLGGNSLHTDHLHLSFPTCGGGS